MHQGFVMKGKRPKKTSAPARFFDKAQWILWCWRKIEEVLVFEGILTWNRNPNAYNGFMKKNPASFLAGLKS